MSRYILSAPRLGLSVLLPLGLLCLAVLIGLAEEREARARTAECTGDAATVTCEPTGSTVAVPKVREGCTVTRVEENRYAITGCRGEREPSGVVPM